MPQMAPLSWLLLFILFNAIFLLFNSLNYFMFLYKMKKTYFNKKKKLINWKW